MDAKPCPFCGSSAAAVIYDSARGPRFVKCYECGAMGPEIRCQTMGEGTPAEWELEAEADAIAAWNDRATASP